MKCCGFNMSERKDFDSCARTNLIKSYYRHLTDPVSAEDSFFHIQIEVDTVKLYLGQFYQFCHESVRKYIDELSDKWTIIEVFSFDHKQVR